MISTTQRFGMTAPKKYMSSFVATIIVNTVTHTYRVAQEQGYKKIQKSAVYISDVANTGDDVPGAVGLKRSDRKDDSRILIVALRQYTLIPLIV